MALTLIKEDGTGLVDANAYANAADGDVYYDGHLYATAWTAATTGNKEKALVMATRLIDSQFQFGGGKTKETQALQWPREDCRDPDGPDFLASDAVPKAVLDATCEMARELLIVDRTAAPAGEGVIATWTDTSGTKYTKPEHKRPVISQVAQTMLAKYGTLLHAKSGSVKLTRV